MMTFTRARLARWDPGIRPTLGGDQPWALFNTAHGGTRLSIGSPVEESAAKEGNMAMSCSVLVSMIGAYLLGRCRLSGEFVAACVQDRISPRACAAITSIYREATHDREAQTRTRRNLGAKPGDKHYCSPVGAQPSGYRQRGDE